MKKAYTLILISLLLPVFNAFSEQPSRWIPISKIALGTSLLLFDVLKCEYNSCEYKVKEDDSWFDVGFGFDFEEEWQNPLPHYLINKLKNLCFNKPNSIHKNCAFLSRLIAAGYFIHSGINDLKNPPKKDNELIEKPKASVSDEAKELYAAVIQSITPQTKEA